MKTKSVLNQEFKQISKLDIDLKPYFSKQSMRTWETRILRLEQKMCVLSPKLISLSFELYEMGLELLSKKIQKYLRNEEKLVQLIKENHHCHTIQKDSEHKDQEDMLL